MKKPTPAKPKTYTVTDGSLVLTLESDGGEWLVVTCPFDPELVTQARSIDEAFRMAYDAKKLLDECRADLARNSRNAGDAAKPKAKPRRRKVVKVEA